MTTKHAIDPEKYKKAIVKAWSNSGYKSKLLSSPHEALSEFGIRMPPDVRICVHENRHSLFHLVLPKAAAGHAGIDKTASGAGRGGYSMGGMSTGLLCAAHCISF